MLNKELLMAVGEGLEPVLSIYFKSSGQAHTKVIVPLSSGQSITIPGQEAAKKTFKFSEIDVTAIIYVTDSKDKTVTTKNLVENGEQARKLNLAFKCLYIVDVTQSASIVI